MQQVQVRKIIHLQDQNKAMKLGQSKAGVCYLVVFVLVDYLVVI